jgi:hypothetical protein
MPTPSKLQRASTNNTAITATGDTTVIAAPGAGFHLEILYIQETNAGATASVVYWKEGVGGAFLYPYTLLAALPNAYIDFLTNGNPWKVASNTAFVMNQSAAGTIHYTVDYFVVPD